MKNMKRSKDDGIEFFHLLMMVLGNTYPKHIFYRRLNLLTDKEWKKYNKKIHKLIDKIYQKFVYEVDDIDEIMKNRSEIAKDKWK